MLNDNGNDNGNSNMLNDNGNDKGLAKDHLGQVLSQPCS